ncbi:MAG: 2,4'-dihydroxyacetophenone dioxygenase family protein [Pseudomonadota bacterium]
MSTQPSHAIPVHITRPYRSAFIDPDTLEWVPWVMEGTWFKLLNVDSKTGGFSMLLKVSPNNEAPIHGHLGDVEGIILSGGFGYVDDDGHAGCYVLEHGGINHKPHTGPDGMEMLAIAHSPLVGYDDDGSVALIVDAKMMYRLARDGGGADHLHPPAQWTDL